MSMSMSTGAAALSETLQTLIDTRLDTIDRMLLGRVPRADRLAIVGEVESQIFELLHGRGSDDPTRDDVLAVLARLDPPEAYLPDEGDGPAAPRARTTPPPPRSLSDHRARAAKPSGILGIVAIALVVLSPAAFVLADLVSGNSTTFVVLLLCLYLLTVGTTAVVSLILAGIARLRGGWAVTGLVTGLVGLLATLAGGILLILELS